MSKIKLNLNQAKFMNCDESVVAFFGGIGNGKTFAGILKGITRVLDPEQPPQLGMIARQTYPELRDSTQRTFFELLHLCGFLPGVHYEYKKQENRCIFANGHEIIFRSLDDPAKLLSINLGWFYIDQAEEVSEEVFLTLLGRLRAVSTPQCWITGNPLGHNWVWHRFIHDPVPGNIMFNAKTEENKANPDFEPSIHVVTDFNPDPAWRRFIAIDHGRTNPTAVLWGAVDNDDKIWIYREHYEAGQDADYHCRAIKAYQGEGRYETYVIDPSTGPGKKDDPETIGNRYRQMNIPVIGANNDVQGGIDKVTEYIKNNKLLITRSCENLRRELVNYQWEQPSASRMDLNSPEKPLKKDDHAVDSLRYMVGEVVRSAKKPDTKTDTQKFIDKIIVDVDSTQPNWDNI